MELTGISQQFKKLPIWIQAFIIVSIFEIFLSVAFDYLGWAKLSWLLLLTILQFVITLFCISKRKSWTIYFYFISGIAIASLAAFNLISNGVPVDSGVVIGNYFALVFWTIIFFTCKNFFNNGKIQDASTENLPKQSVNLKAINRKLVKIAVIGAIILILLILIPSILIFFIGFISGGIHSTNNFGSNQVSAGLLDMKKGYSEGNYISVIEGTSAVEYSLAKSQEISLQDVAYFESKFSGIKDENSSLKNYGFYTVMGFQPLSLAISILKISKMDLNKSATEFKASLDNNIAEVQRLKSIATDPIVLDLEKINGYYKNDVNYSKEFVSESRKYTDQYLTEFITYKQQSVIQDFSDGDTIKAFIEGYELNALKEAYSK